MSRKLVLFISFLSIAGFAIHAAESESTHPARSESAAIDAAEQTSGEVATDPGKSILSPQNLSVEGLETTTSDDGVTKVDLEGRFSHALVLRIAPDGSRSVECIDSHERAAELLRPLQQSAGDEGREE